MKTTTHLSHRHWIPLVLSLPITLLFPSSARSSGGDPASELKDLYAFTHQGDVVLAMSLYPFAPAGATFSTTTQHVFHTSSGPSFGKSPSNLDIVCTFANAHSISCWLGKDDYANGDPSDPSKPLTSINGTFRVFAGLRADPMFFNLSGFTDTVEIVRGAEGALTFDATGCPAIDSKTSSALVNTLSEIPSKANPSRTNPDDFLTANVLALVVSVNRSALTAGGNYVAVWASTNQVTQ